MINLKLIALLLLSLPLQSQDTYERVTSGELLKQRILALEEEVTIIHLPQIHWDARTVVASTSEEDLTHFNALREVITKSQFRIALELLTYDNPQIFDEGLDKEVSLLDTGSLDLPLKEQTEEIFKGVGDKFPETFESLTDVQQNVLFTRGAATTLVHLEFVDRLRATAYKSKEVSERTLESYRISEVIQTIQDKKVQLINELRSKVQELESIAHGNSIDDKDLQDRLDYINTLRNELEKLHEEHIRLIESWDKIVMQDREIMTLNLILDCIQEGLCLEGPIILVYGAAHDFSLHLPEESKLKIVKRDELYLDLLKEFRLTEEVP